MLSKITTFLLLAFFSPEPEPRECVDPDMIATPEPEPAAECGAPLCITIKEGIAYTGACDDNCGTWAPGVVVTCGDLVCQPSGAASECRWVCRPREDW